MKIFQSNVRIVDLDFLTRRIFFFPILFFLNNNNKSPNGTLQYENHLDWHFRKNKRDKEKSRKAQSREWYYPLEVTIFSFFFFSEFNSNLSFFFKKKTWSTFKQTDTEDLKGEFSLFFFILSNEYFIPFSFFYFKKSFVLF